jgi:hypothetical protein
MIYVLNTKNKNIVFAFISNIKNNRNWENFLYNLAVGPI